MLPSLVRRWIWVAIVVVIGVAAIVMIGDVHQLAAQLETFGWWAFAAALGLALTNYAIRFLRWQLYLRWQGVSVPRGVSAIVFGAGLSLSITPAKLGELVKSYLLRELHDIPATQTAPIVVAERVTDLLALLLLAVVGVAVYGVETTLVVVGGRAGRARAGPARLAPADPRADRAGHSPAPHPPVPHPAARGLRRAGRAVPAPPASWSPPGSRSRRGRASASGSR